MVKQLNKLSVKWTLSIVAVQLVQHKFPEVTILTSEVHPVAPNHFGQKYFGTEWWMQCFFLSELCPLACKLAVKVLAKHLYMLYTGNLCSYITAGFHKFIFTK